MFGLFTKLIIDNKIHLPKPNGNTWKKVNLYIKLIVNIYIMYV